MGPFPIVLAALLVLAVGLAILVFWIRHMRIRKIAEALAESWGGEYSRPGGVPRIDFVRNGVPFRVQWNWPDGNPVIEIFAQLPNDGFRLKIFESVVSDRLKRFLGMQDLRVGWDLFDRRYVVQSNDPLELEHWLTPDVQRLIWDLGRSIEVQIFANRLVVTLELPRFERTLVQDCVRRVAGIHAALLANAQKARTPALLMSEVVNLDDAICLVCGEPIADRRVDCRACQTAHHAECWEYIGNCSRFACGHRDYQVHGDPREIYRIRT